MKNSKKVIVLSHCVLNEHSKVRKWEEEKSTELTTMDFLKLLLDNGIGIIQLPCPELIGYGLNRWGQVKEQYDHPHYRRTCREIFEPVLDQILEYKANGFEIISLMGIYGSPTCGISKTCSGQWGGEIGSNPNIEKTINTVCGIDASGIFMEEIMEIFKANKLDIPMIDFNKNELETTIEAVKNLI